MILELQMFFILFLLCGLHEESRLAYMGYVSLNFPIVLEIVDFFIVRNSNTHLNWILYVLSLCAWRFSTWNEAWSHLDSVFVAVVCEYWNPKKVGNMQFHRLLVRLSFFSFKNKHVKIYFGGILWIIICNVCIWTFYAILKKNFD